MSDKQKDHTKGPLPLMWSSSVLPLEGAINELVLNS